MKIQLFLALTLLVLTLNAGAQTTQPDTAKIAVIPGSVKLFGGASQYSAFSIGLNAGVTSGQLQFFNNTTNTFKADIGFGADLRYQLTHAFSIQLEYYGGKVSGSDGSTNQLNTSGQTYTGNAFHTSFNSFSLGAMFDIGSISFLHRQNGLLLFGTAGTGLDFYKPSPTLNSTGMALPYTNTVKELATPLGTGLKFRLSDALALNLGYTVTFVDGYNFSGFHSYPLIDHYAYTYAGLEHTFGTKKKPNIEWVNPVALMYDEIYDAALRMEVLALKNRVTNVEKSVKNLQKDSDGDGVSDQFDKCPNTPAGIIVDGGGCPLISPALIDTSSFVLKLYSTIYFFPKTAAYSNIQFALNSAVLTPKMYASLDVTFADLRYTGASVQLNGFASSDEGSAAHTMTLSRERAMSVKIYLVKSGMTANKIIIKPFGQTHPIADNTTEAGRMLNRRVEFKGITTIPNEEDLVRFNPGQSALMLNPKLIDAAIKALRLKSGSKVTLIGHCSSVEPFSDDETLKSDKYKKLALARIKTVVSYLVKRGIALNRIIQIESSGKPFNGDDTSINGQADNRSVEINVK